VLGRLRSVFVPALTTAISLGLAGLPGAPAPPGGPAPGGMDWVVDLAHGNAMNVSYTGGALQLTGPTGLLTLPAYRVAMPVGRVSPQLDSQVPPGTAATVDVRGQLPGGRWSEWLPSRPNMPVTLPGPSVEVQLRVVLTAAADPATPHPSVLGLRVHSEVVPNMRVDAPPSQPDSYQVTATREGLVDGRTANGHVIGPHELFVALPSRSALSDLNGSEYSVKVCASSGYCAWAPVWDVGPWNITDNYWSSQRDDFDDLPQGVPEAQAAFRDGYHDGQDGTGRTVTNPAGIDLSDGVYQTALGLSGTEEVTVSYLWTGNTPLSAVAAGGTDQDDNSAAQATAAFPVGVQALGSHRDSGDDSDSDSGDDSNDRSGHNSDHDSNDGSGHGKATVVTVRTAPDAQASVAGVAADHAGVPVQCATSNGWLRIDENAYLPANTVRASNQVGPC
jgi:hypothetical protein